MLPARFRIVWYGQIVVKLWYIQKKTETLAFVFSQSEAHTSNCQHTRYLFLTWIVTCDSIGSHIVFLQNSLKEPVINTNTEHQSVNYFVDWHFQLTFDCVCFSGRIPTLSLIRHSLYMLEKPPPTPLPGEQYGKMEPKYPDGGHCQSVLRSQGFFNVPLYIQGRRQRHLT